LLWHAEVLAEKGDSDEAEAKQGLNRLRKNSEWMVKGPKLGDSKSLPDPSRSFLGLPGAICFCHFPQN
jgi:hypothetical protein